MSSSSAFAPSLALFSHQGLPVRSTCRQPACSVRRTIRSTLEYTTPRISSIPASSPVAEPTARKATVTRTTKETSVTVKLNVDGTGLCDVETGIPFLDHMLAQLCSHGLFDLHVRAKGDLWIDDHHTNEDVGITLGMALSEAVGTKKGIRRFGHFVAPLDESLVEVVLDFSGRAHTTYSLAPPTERVGTYDTQLTREFYIAVADNAKITLHMNQRYGINSHHIIEASFKAFARAMRMALEYDPRRLDSVPSSKGVLTDEGAVGQHQS